MFRPLTIIIETVCTSVLMKLFLFIMGTNFTKNISDAFLLTVSVYIKVGYSSNTPRDVYSGSSRIVYSVFVV